MKDRLKPNPHPWMKNFVIMPREEKDEATLARESAIRQLDKVRTYSRTSSKSKHRVI